MGAQFCSTKTFTIKRATASSAVANYKPHIKGANNGLHIPYKKAPRQIMSVLKRMWGDCL